MTELRVAREADGHISAIQEWWLEHRPAAPALFTSELADALELLTRTPAIGTAYRRNARPPIRRMVLARSRYYVYFTYDADADIVEVRAVWHTARGSDPPLP